MLKESVKHSINVKKETKDFKKLKDSIKTCTEKRTALMRVCLSRPRSDLLLHSWKRKLKKANKCDWPIKEPKKARRCWAGSGSFICGVSLLTWRVSAAPGPVGHLSFTEILDTSLKVSWKEPHEKNGVLTGAFSNAPGPRSCYPAVESVSICMSVVVVYSSQATGSPGRSSTAPTRGSRTTYPIWHRNTGWPDWPPWPPTPSK